MAATMPESAPPHAHELLTPSEAVAYLRLDADGGNSAEKLRNLIRRHGLPVCKRGNLQRFRRSEIDRWLNGERVSRRPAK